MNTMLSQAAGVTTKSSTQQSCTRCRGYLASEVCIDLESDNGKSVFRALRCVQCGDIVEELPLSQSTVSQHLKELKDAGLIKGEIEGAKVCYCIDEKEWKAAQAVLNQMFETYKGGSNCC